jgi:hypothetical protein
MPDQKRFGLQAMCVGVKFCGGCNPRYDRMKAFETIKGGLEKDVAIKFEYASEGGAYDALLLLSGCTNRCADLSGFTYGGRLVSVWDADGVEEAIRELSSLRRGIDGLERNL